MKRDRENVRAQITIPNLVPLEACGFATHATARRDSATAAEKIAQEMRARRQLSDRPADKAICRSRKEARDDARKSRRPTFQRARAPSRRDQCGRASTQLLPAANRRQIVLPPPKK